MEEYENNGIEETLDTQNTEADTELDLDIEMEDEEVDYKSKAEKAEELANNYKIRAEKAESKLKQVKPEVKQNSNELSIMDAMLLSKANVELEDVDTVTKFAKMEGLTIAEALKNDELKAILNVRAEKKTVAQASHTGSSRRASNQISDDVLLAKASKGELPDSPEDIARLNRLRWGKKG